MPSTRCALVPGGSAPVSVLLKGHLGQNPYLDFLARQAAGARLVCSISAGALLQAGAGLLDGHVATTHRAFKEVLKLFSCIVVDDYRRYVQNGNRITGGAIPSGLDLALYIVAVLYGVRTAREGQLAMHYNPQPAFHCGDPGDVDIKGDPGIFQVEQARAAVRNWLGK